jgi:hypothetical protein
MNVASALAEHRDHSQPSVGNLQGMCVIWWCSLLAEREEFFRCTVLLWELNTRDFLRQSDCQQVAAVGRRLP